jgi:hypothetical protein
VQTRIGDNKLAGALFCLLERYFACWSVILLAAPRVLSSRSLLSPSRLDYLVTNSRLDHAVLFSPKHESTIVHLFHSIYR